MTQHNSYRKIGPPVDWEGPPPPKGCEIFIGKLPHEILENELFSIFSQAGRIYELRLMLTILGTNRGYAFIKYGSRLEASAAIRDLHNYEIRSGRRIAVVKSVDNCRLYVGGIPKYMSEETVKRELSKCVRGIIRVILNKNCYDRRYNRGFAFIEFNTHCEAAVARRITRLHPVTLGEHNLMVDWAEPEPDVDDEVMKKVKILYVRNLSIHTDSRIIREIFEKAAGHKIERVKKMYDYAFIHFYKREHAEITMKTLQNIEIDGVNIEIKWAKPVDRNVYRVQKKMKGNSKFNNTTAFGEALLLYNEQMSRRECALDSPDEGIVSFSANDSCTCSIDNNIINKEMNTEKKCNMHFQDYLNLEDMCKRFQWASPKYHFQNYMTTNGQEIWVCRIEFSHSGSWGVPQFQVTSLPCATQYEAQICATYVSWTHLEMMTQNGFSKNMCQHKTTDPVSTSIVPIQFYNSSIC